MRASGRFPPPVRWDVLSHSCLCSHEPVFYGHGVYSVATEHFRNNPPITPRTPALRTSAGRRHVGTPCANQRLVTRMPAAIASRIRDQAPQPCAANLKAVHDKVTAIEFNLREKSLLLPVHILTDALSDFRPDKIDVKHAYMEVDFAIGSRFIRHALDDHEPIADLQGNKYQVPYARWEELTQVGIFKWYFTYTRAVDHLNSSWCFDVWMVFYPHNHVYTRTSPALELHTPPVIDNLSTKYAVIASDSAAAGQTPHRHLPGGGGLVVRLVDSHQGEPSSIPGGVASAFSRVGIAPDDATARRVFSGVSRSYRPFIPALLHTHLVSPSSALNSSMLRATQTSSLTRSANGMLKVAGVNFNGQGHQHPTRRAIWQTGDRNDIA
ncbi:hypothetical protein PR048_020588 [Dryococelus australis]|uniref:Uncharacterized protein n=1 Tax=Dryococelus australis TaxID=614101 RepID=A0ABQ9H6R2_9NEOP|nr:hypothetical protein PR048_020588 [Dryococelus australis]